MSGAHVERRGGGREEVRCRALKRHMRAQPAPLLIGLEKVVGLKT